MKKIISIILVLSMLFSLAACAPAKKDNEPQTPPDNTDIGDTVPDDADNNDTAPIDAAPIDDIPLDTILSLFGDMTDIGLDELMHVNVSAEEAGYEMGYDSFAGEFESAMALKPMMNTSPFVLMVYRLAEGADASAFAADIEKNANPAKWICVQADRVFTRVSGRTVLFVMCPNDMMEPITDCFAEMTAEGFDPDEHIIDPLADKTPQDLYDELYQLFSAEEYGFMDNEAVAALGADTAYGLSKLDLTKIADSVFDDGYAAANAEDPERAYVLIILKVKEKGTEEAVLAEIQDALDTSELAGGEASCVSAYGGGFVIVYAGTGTYGISATALGSYLPITYRLAAETF